jgi:mono/diheme cytochrome c family protein
VGVSSVEFYSGRPDRIPGWDQVLLLTTLKRGSLYVLPLTPDGKKAAGHFSRYFQAENRYRDTAIHPNGKIIYIATDPGGMAESRSGGITTNMEDKGAILSFTYAGEGAAPAEVSQQRRPEPAAAAIPDIPVSGPGIAPQFSAQQVTAGKKLYDSYCAVCHGSTLSNGTFGTPLTGEYFKGRWSGRSVAALFAKSKNTMPPAAPASLPDASYASVLAYILDVNGAKAGAADLPGGGDALRKMRLD